jgi:hypothetical protein
MNNQSAKESFVDDRWKDVDTEHEKLHDAEVAMSTFDFYDYLFIYAFTYSFIYFIV